MIEFITNIKATPELATMFESIQKDAKDALSSINESTPMEAN